MTVEIVVATLVSAEPADRPAVFLGGVAVPARSILLEQRIPEAKSIHHMPPAGEVVLEIRAEPRDVDNGETVEVVRRPAKPWSETRCPADFYGPGYADTAGSGTHAWLEAVGDGEVAIRVGDSLIPVSEHTLVLHRDEILTFATELIALASRETK